MIITWQIRHISAALQIMWLEDLKLYSDWVSHGRNCWCIAASTTSCSRYRLHQYRCTSWTSLQWALQYCKRQCWSNTNCSHCVAMYLLGYCYHNVLKAALQYCKPQYCSTCKLHNCCSNFASCSITIGETQIAVLLYTYSYINKSCTPVLQATNNAVLGLRAAQLLQSCKLHYYWTARGLAA